MRTLVVPFLFWNVLILSLVFLAKALGVDSISRGNGAYFNVQPTLSSVASALLGLGRPPIVYQFWFLRDLIVVSVASFVVCRTVPGIPVLPWLLLFIPIPMAGSMGYFLLGYTLHRWFPSPQYLVGQSPGWHCIALSLVGCGTLVLCVLWVAGPYPLQQIGAAACILLLSLLVSRSAFGQRLAGLGSATFLIYALHEPMQTILAKVWLIQGWPLHGSLACVLLIPLVVLPACILAYALLRRWSPWLLPYATGGR